MGGGEGGGSLGLGPSPPLPPGQLVRDHLAPFPVGKGAQVVMGHPVNGAWEPSWAQGGGQRRRARATRGAATARGRGGPRRSYGLAGRSALDESGPLSEQQPVQNTLFTRGGGVQGARAGRRARGCGPRSRGPWERPRRRGPTPRSFGRSPGASGSEAAGTHRPVWQDPALRCAGQNLKPKPPRGPLYLLPEQNRPCWRAYARATAAARRQTELVTS